MSSIEYNNKELNKIIIENTLKMLLKRNVIDSVDLILAKFDNFNNQIYEFSVSENIHYNINIINAKITSLSIGSPIDEYLSSNINVNKILIIKDFNKKVIKDITSIHKNVELFFIKELQEDIYEKIFQPDFELLNEENKNEILQKFHSKELSTIFATDRMARYFKAKPGDIFRITRSSVTAGHSIFYRQVGNSNWDILF